MTTETHEMTQITVNGNKLFASILISGFTKLAGRMLDFAGKIYTYLRSEDGLELYVSGNSVVAVAE